MLPHFMSSEILPPLNYLCYVALSDVAYIDVAHSYIATCDVSPKDVAFSDVAPKIRCVQ